MILVVEDNELMRELICDIIQKDKRHFVDVVTTGEDAIQKAARNYYSMIFMDLELPGICGIDTAIAIHNLPTPFCNVPIIALNSMKEIPGLDHWDEAKFAGTLIKPFSVQELTDLVIQYDTPVSQ